MLLLEIYSLASLDVDWMIIRYDCNLIIILIICMISFRYIDKMNKIYVNMYCYIYIIYDTYTKKFILEWLFFPLI